MQSAALQFPWRQLGELLVAEELLTDDELEQALTEQSATGRLLGQIIVANGYLSAFSLARVLSEQHGVQLSPKEGAPATPTLVPSEPEAAWRPLGKVLVDMEFLTESQLERALVAQQRRRGPPRRDPRLPRPSVWRRTCAGARRATRRRTGRAGRSGIARGRPSDQARGAGVHALRGDLRARVPTAHSALREHELPRSRRSRIRVRRGTRPCRARDPPHARSPRGDRVELQREPSRSGQCDRKNLAETFGFDPTAWGKDL